MAAVPRSTSRPRPCPRIIAVSNQKGGEGKTTTAVNVAASLAAAEHPVLLIDMDPQGNASSSVGYPRGAAAQGTYELLLDGASLDQVIVQSDLPTLHVLPASPDLAGAEVELVSVEGRESVLRRALAPLRDPCADNLRFDYVILDCPPSLGLLTVNALVAADTVLIPMQAKYFSLEGLGALQGTIESVRGALNEHLEIEGILFCMFDRRTNLAQQVVTEVRDHFGELVYDTVIPVNIRLSESPSHGKPVLLYDIESKGAKAYLELTREILSRHAAQDGLDDATPSSTGTSNPADALATDSDPSGSEPEVVAP
jgi:chromosome partitioning protein